MTKNKFSTEILTHEEAFWVMFYFLDEHYKLSNGNFDLSDVLSASQPFEFDENGHFDGDVKSNREISPADSSMILYWNEALKKFKDNGIPPVTPLTK